MGWLSSLSWRSARSPRLTRKTSGTSPLVERRHQVVVGAVGPDLDGGLVVGGVVGVDDGLVGVGLLLGPPDTEGQVDLGDRAGRRRAGRVGILVVTGAPGDGGAQHQREGHHDPPALHHTLLSARATLPMGHRQSTAPCGPVSPDGVVALRLRHDRSKTSRLTAAPSRRIASSSSDDQPVQAHLARPVLGVPGAGADVHPVPAVTAPRPRRPGRGPCWSASARPR